MRRDRELALRAALGAGRGRLLRQLLTESTLLSVAGGALGLVFAALGLNTLVDFTARFTPRTADIEIDLQVLAFTLAVSVITGVAAGALPGLWIHADGPRALREGSSSQTTTGRATLRLRRLLIAGQVALSFMLLIGAGLLMSSFIKLSRVDTGFGAANVLTAEVIPNWTEYENLDRRTELFTDLLGALETAPGVVSAAVAALATPKLTTTLIGLFAALAMVITVAGIGGVMAFSVSQRRHEIGIRIAVGAERRAVLGTVLHQGLSMVLAGLAFGVLGALWFSNLVAAFLFETEPTDPLTFFAVGVIFLLATVIACWLPARRATAIDPVVALRAG